MSATVEEVQEEQTEAKRVMDWRLHVLVQADYPVRLAERLAGSNVDLHEAVALVERGCSPSTAVKILI